MTIEELADAVQRDFEVIRGEIVTRAELRAAESTIVKSIEGMSAQLESYATRTVEDFDRLSGRIASIESRLVCK